MNFNSAHLPCPVSYEFDETRKLFVATMA